MKKVFDSSIPKRSFLDPIYKSISEKINQPFIEKKEDGILFQDTNFLVKEQTTLIPIDSKFRDKTKWPKPNNFVLSLRKNFENVKKIEIVSSVFPNTDNAIVGSGPRQNNRVYWQNKTDFIKFTTTLVYDSINKRYILTVIDYFTFSKTIDCYIFGSFGFGISLINGYHTGTIIFNDQKIGTVQIAFYFSFQPDEPDEDKINFNFIIPQSIYSCNVTEGNYNIETISENLFTNFQKVYKLDKIDFHYFFISIDRSTDIISFENLNIYELDNNPITTELSSYIVQVASPNFNFLFGKILRLLDSQSVGGILPDVLNTEQTITPIDNGFEFTIPNKANFNTTAGGNSVKLGDPQLFKFLFSPLDRNNDPVYLNSIQEPLGFLAEETNDSLPENCLTTYSSKITNIIPGTITSIVTESSLGLLKVCRNYTFTDITDNIITYIEPSFSGRILSEKTQIFIYCPFAITVDAELKNISGFYTAIYSGSFRIKIIDQNLPDLLDVGSIAVIKIGDRIKLQGVKLNSTFKNYIGPNEFFVESLISNTITVDYTTTGYSFVKDSEIKSNRLTETIDPRITTSLLIVNHPNHGFNEIIDILDSILPDDLDNEVVRYQTLLPLNNLVNYVYMCTSINVDINNILTISFTKNSLDIFEENNFYFLFVKIRAYIDLLKTLYFKCISVIGNDVIFTTDISQLPNLVDYFPFSSIGYVSRSLRLTVLGITNQSQINIQMNNEYYLWENNGSELICYHNCAVDVLNTNFEGNQKVYLNSYNNDFRLFRVKSDVDSDTIRNVPLAVINNVNHTPRLIDSNFYCFSCENFFFYGSPISFGGSDIRISSDLHGWKDKISNTSDYTVNSELSRKISLEGENYVFMSIPNPKMRSNIINPSSDIQDIFAQIVLAGPPGSIIFNEHISEPYIFYPFLQNLNEIQLQILYNDGNLYDFKDTNYSVTLKITQVIKYLLSENDS